MDFWNQVIKKFRFDTLAPKEIVVELTNYLHKPSLVLDIGCGRGRHLSYLSNQGCMIIGTDISPDALLHCRNKVKRERSRIFFVENDVAALSFRRELFDAVIATNSLHYNNIAGIRSAIREIYQALKPYGWIAATVSSSSLSHQKGIELEPGTFIRDIRDRPVLQHFFTEQELMKLFGQFTIVKLYETKDNGKEEGEGHWCILAQKR
ncbi:class I SAM-dependent methyltransferase [Candidatus Woesearchaeota archaeon]|nr:class I SAM-dependent methyltransferase [Candidatus Woesearchaeota archaeon]